MADHDLARIGRRRRDGRADTLCEIVGVHHHLSWHASDEGLQQQIAFCRGQIGRAQTNQIIREQREVFRIRTGGAELREEGVVARLAVFAFGLEPSHGHRLGQLNHSRQPFTISRDRVSA